MPAKKFNKNNNKTLAKHQNLIISQLFSGKKARLNFPSTPEKTSIKLTFQEFPILGDCSALSEHQDEESVSMSTSDSEEDRGVKKDMDEIDDEEEKTEEWVQDEPDNKNVESVKEENLETQDLSDQDFADYCEELEQEFQESYDDDYDPYPNCTNKYYSQEFVAFYQHKLRENKTVYRKTNKNKKEKINTERYINANVQRREAEKIAQIASEVLKQKENARKHITQTIDCGWDRRADPYSSNSNAAAFGNAGYEKDLQKAMSASRTEKHESGLTYAQLMELLSRDLTPEDYDLLLALDTTVKKKTADTNSINALKELVASEENCNELCSVCMCNYEVGEPMKALPCEHVFHKGCITTWLENHSQSCPLCNAKV